MKITPLNGLVLIKRDPPRTAQGLIQLPGGVSALEQRSRDNNPGTVVAVSEACWVGRVENGKRVYRWFEPTLRPGDRIHCGFRVNNTVGDDLCMMHEWDLLDKITEE